MASDAAIFKAVFSVLVLPNLVGNSLVVFIILRSPAMKSPMNYLLLNLAASDLLVGVGMLPGFLFSDIVEYPRGSAGNFLCKAVLSTNFAWVGATASVFSLTFISIERYYVIMKPLDIRYRITNKKLRLFVLISWATAVVFCSPLFFVVRLDEDGLCTTTWPDAWYKHAYYCLWLLVGAVLPCATMAALYARVIRFLWSDGGDSGDVTSQAVRRSRKKVTVTMLALSVVYAVCWFPDLVMHVVANAAPEQFSLDHPVHTVAICLVVVNSSVNPFVYAFRFDQFKREFRKIFCCCDSSNDRSTPETNGVFVLEMSTRHTSVIIEAGPVRAIRYTRVTTEPEQVTSTGNSLTTPRPDNIPLVTVAREMPEFGQVTVETDTRMITEP